MFSKSRLDRLLLHLDQTIETVSNCYKTLLQLIVFLCAELLSFVPWDHCELELRIDSTDGL